MLRFIKTHTYLYLALVLLLPLHAHAQPRIVFEQETHIFGDVMQGDTVEHVFEFRNDGNEELTIDKVSSS